MLKAQCWKYTIFHQRNVANLRNTLANCYVWNYTLYSRHTRSTNNLSMRLFTFPHLRTSSYFLFTRSAPPKWRRGFIFSSTASLYLMYRGWPKKV